MFTKDIIFSLYFVDNWLPMQTLRCLAEDIAILRGLIAKTPDVRPMRVTDDNTALWT